MIPSGWDQQRIGKRIKVRCGFAFKSELFRETGVPIVRISNIQNGRVELQGSPCYDETDNMEQFKVRFGDVLIAMSGATTGKVGRFFPEDTGAYAYLNQRVGKFEVKDTRKTDPDYFHQITQTNRFIRSVLIDSIGGAQPNVSGNEIENIVLGWPPLPEQKKIAQILSTWDKAIEAVDKLIENSQKQKKWLMQNLLTGKKRLPGFSGEWKSIKIGKLVKEVRRRVEWDDEQYYNLISVKRRSEGLFLRECLQGCKILTKKMKIARQGDFLISKMQVLHGATGLVSKDFDGFHISDSYIALVARDSAPLSIEYFDMLSKTAMFRDLTYKSSHGVHIEKMTFDFSSFLEKSICLPVDIEEQRAITRAINGVFCLEKALSRILGNLSSEKKALMQQLLTGKRRVKVDETHSPALAG